jgi:hypothetical protein
MTHASLLIISVKMIFCLMEHPVFRVSAIRYCYKQQIMTKN